MPSLITADPLALRILMDEDIYSLGDGPAEKSQAGKMAIPEVLVAEKTAVIEPQPVAESPVSYNYLGENNKYLLVLVNEIGYEFSSPKNLEVLTNILKGKQLEIKDIALLNIAKHPPVDFKSLKEYFACSKIILFGIDPAAIGLHNTPSNKIHEHGAVRVIATYSFEEMQDDVGKKRIFWNEMKLL